MRKLFFLGVWISVSLYLFLLGWTYYVERKPHNHLGYHSERSLAEKTNVTTETVENPLAVINLTLYSKMVFKTPNESLIIQTNNCTCDSSNNLTEACTGRIYPAIIREKHHDQCTFARGHQVNRFMKTKKTLSISEKRDTFVNLLAAFDLLVSLAKQNTKNDINYWLYAGSLLGQWCYKGPLPKDSDVDIGMLVKDFKNLTAFVGANPTFVSPQAQFVVRTGKDSDIIMAKFINVTNGLYIDVAAFYEQVGKDKKDMLRQKHSNGRCVGCDARGLLLPVEYVLPTRRCPFGNISVNCPNETEKICRKLFKTPFYECPAEYMKKKPVNIIFRGGKRS